MLKITESQLTRISSRPFYTKIVFCSQFRNYLEKMIQYPSQFTQNKVNPPTPKDIVELLCKKAGTEVKEVVSKDKKTKFNVLHLVYLCPRGDLCKCTDGKIYIKKKQRIQQWIISPKILRFSRRP